MQQETELLLSLGDDFDLNFDDLSCLISPKHSLTIDSSTPSTTTTNVSAQTTKISPLVMDVLQLEMSRPSINSVRGYDINNNPVFSSSQTPHDFQVMTKRKTSKKSVFNFENVDVSTETSNRDKSFKTNYQYPSGTISVDSNFTTSPIDIDLETAANLTNLGFDADEILLSNNENIFNHSQFSSSTDWNPLSPTSAKNPRKKKGGHGTSFDSVILDDTLYSENSIDDFQSTGRIEHQPPLLGAPSDSSTQSCSVWADSSTATFQYPSDFRSSGTFNMTLPSISNALYATNMFSDLTPIPAESLLNLSGKGNSLQHSNSADYQHYLQMKVQNMKINSSSSPTEATFVDTSESRVTKKSSERQSSQENQLSAANNRASKSLTEISRRFVTIYGRDNTLDYIAGLVDPKQYSESSTSFNRVDAAAESLNVHVRRIYELIKILEILSLVAFAGDKRGKFSWRGTKNFLLTLGTIQNEGIKCFPILASQSGLCQSSEFRSHLHEETQKAHNANSLQLKNKNASASFDAADYSTWNELNILDNDTQEALDLLSTFDNDDEEISISSNVNVIYPAVKVESRNGAFDETRKKQSLSSTTNSEEPFMVEVICKRFLQLFLVGMNTLSMSSAIQKLIPMEENQLIADYNKINATKIRRVYDVTNVLCSLNLIRKKSVPKMKALKADVTNSIDSMRAYEFAKKAIQELEDDISIKHKKTNSKSSADRADTKVLEWTSFSPQIIRQHYLQAVNSNSAR